MCRLASITVGGGSVRLVVGLLLACLGVLAPVRVEMRLLPMAMPHALVGTWAPVCGSVAGELYGITISQDGRMVANDGTEVCWIETIRSDDQALSPGRMAAWQVAGNCRGDRRRRFQGTMSLQRLDGDVVLQRNDGTCSDACVHFPLKRC
jgi:hypothetical protein